MSQRTPLAASVGAGVGFHAAARSGGALQNQSPAVANVTIQQVLGSMVTTFSLSVPHLGQQGATADVSFTQALGLPNITLAKGAAGLVVVTLDLAQQGNEITVNFSRQLQYGGISPQNVWTLPPGATFNGGKVVGVARIVALATAAAQTLTVLCNAHVVGIPATGAT